MSNTSVLIDKRSMSRNRKNKKWDVDDYMRHWIKKLHECYHAFSNDFGWRIIESDTKEVVATEAAAAEWMRLWIFNHSKAFNKLPENLREARKQAYWELFVTEHMKYVMPSYAEKLGVGFASTGERPQPPSPSDRSTEDTSLSS